MISTMCSSSRWWSEISENDGLGLLDQHVGPDANWEHAAKTGSRDWERARSLTEIPAGPELDCLEIGCGAGRMTNSLAADYRQVVAVDVSETYLRCARQHCSASNVIFRAAGGDDLQAAADRQYDVAFSYEVFHYLAPTLLQRYFHDTYGLLRPGGQFVFEVNTEPLRWITRCSLWVRRILHACGKQSWRGWPTSPHFVRKLYSTEAIGAWLRQAGFTVSRVIDPGHGVTWFVSAKSPAGVRS